MFIDHYGIIFMHNNFYLRLIGRISFPIFSFLIAYNYLYRTSNKFYYFKRLLIFSFISQLAYYYTFETYRLNIFFTYITSILIYEILNNINTNLKEKKKLFI